MNVQIPMADKEQQEGETIFEGDNADNTNDNEEVLGLDDITSSNLVTLEKGETLILTVAEVRKNYSGKFELSEVDYNIHIVDAEGEVFPINAWTLWNDVRQAFREAQERDLIGSTAGLQLKINRGEDDGDYEVFWKTSELEDWQRVETDG